MEDFFTLSCIYKEDFFFSLSKSIETILYGHVRNCVKL